MNGTVYITCLGDTFYTDIVKAMRRVLGQFGVDTACPPGQTCCGQPMFNAGYFKDAAKAAAHFIDVFGEMDGPIICPSASCTAMVRDQYPILFKDDPKMLAKANKVAARTFEFTEFVVKELKVDLTDFNAAFDASVTFHYSCHFRHLNMTDEPAELIKQIKGIEYIPLKRMDQCCGFGGTFSVNYPHVSEKMVEDKVKCIRETGAEWLIFADAGCAMNITGYASKSGQPIKAMHIAELIDKAIGETI
jgi:L-lactate dehydrogenase complex protein LldE